MNGVVKSTLKSVFSKSFSSLVRQNVVNEPAKRQFARTLWHVCSNNDASSNNLGRIQQNQPSILCQCGCGAIRGAHTKGEKELAEFLTEEIDAEKKLQKQKTIPSEIEGFQVKLEGAEVTLTKKNGDETVQIFFNVNHSVDSEAEPEINPNADNPEVELRSKPTFEVELKRGSKVIGFTCSYLIDTDQSEDECGDIFGIDELAIYDKEWEDSTYAVSGQVLDGYLYDLLMNLLEEKGVSNEFVSKMSDLSTVYEHLSYINLLVQLQNFASGK
ncbi:complement component 1 Q subcomponent-binding protein, mitochondrial isoform X2 [Bemisia tabaci]|nr:PREDICTED: complement component 1 Q subcomponent-binding protein, mitochondrial isoform X2 [Bemisia tabaci]